MSSALEAEERDFDHGCEQIDSEAGYRPPTVPAVPIPQQHAVEVCRRPMCNTIASRATIIESRGVAQPGSASALGAEGRGFESLRPDQDQI